MTQPTLALPSLRSADALVPAGFILISLLCIVATATAPLAFYVVMTALFGRLMDRYGIHKVALPAATVYGLALCGFSLIQSNTAAGVRRWANFVIAGCPIRRPMP